MLPCASQPSRVAVITAEELYSGVSFQACILKLTDGTHVALSRDFPETLGHCKRAKSALRVLCVNAQSTLVSAMRLAGVYRLPTESAPLTVADVASMLDQDCANMVASIEPVTFVVFPK
jgi:hypothetical protein